MTLTDSQRAEIVQALDVAEIAASLTPSNALDREERVSLAHYYLCLAALAWEPSGPFRSYALTFVRWRLRDEQRRAVRLKRRRRPVKDRPEAVDRMEVIERHDLARRLMDRFPLLSRRERQTLELYMSGLGCSDVARAMGISREMVWRYRRSAADRLIASCQIRANDT